MAKYVAFVSKGQWAGFTTLESWQNMPLDCKGDIDDTITFNGPVYVTEGLTAEEIDAQFKTLKERSQNLVAENNLWLAVINVGSSIRQLSAALVSVALRAYPRLEKVRDLVHHLRA